MPLTMRADSTEYVTATITADHDITGTTISVSLPTANTAPTTWYVAEVVSVAPISSSWRATYRVLVGPAGAIQLTPGTYDWTCRLTDDPEVPVRKAGVVTITAT
jgi:hypothetical protein